MPALDGEKASLKASGRTGRRLPCENYPRTAMCLALGFGFDILLCFCAHLRRVTEFKAMDDINCLGLSLLLRKDKVSAVDF